MLAGSGPAHKDKDTCKFPRRLAPVLPGCMAVMLGCTSATTPPDVIFSERAPIGAGQSKEWPLALPAARPVVIDVVQEGVDVRLDVISPGGQLVSVDSHLMRYGTETVLLLEPLAGEYLVRAATSDALPGHVVVQVAALSAATPADRKRIEALALVTQAGVLSRQALESADDSNDLRLEAARLCLQAADLSEGVAGESLYEAAMLHYDSGLWAEADRIAARAARVARKLDDTTLLAALRHLQAQALVELEDSEATLAAFDHLAAAEAMYARQGDVRSQADVINTLGITYFTQGRLASARDEFLRSATLLDELGDPGAHRAYNNTGKIDEKRGELIAASASYQKALDLVPADSYGAVMTLENFAGVRAMLGEVDDALLMYQRVADLSRQMGSRASEARALDGMGFLFYRLGDYDRAVDHLQQALAMQENAAEVRPLVDTHINLGNALRASGAIEQAVDQHRLALERTGRDAERATAHLELGRDLLALGRADKARDHFDLALDLARSNDEPVITANALQERGELTGRDNPEVGIAELTVALERHRKLDALDGEIRALTELARLRQRLGDSGQALKLVREAVTLTETLRRRIGNRNLRYSFTGVQHPTYALQTDLLMELHAADPDAGYDALALEVVERSKARTLAELITQTGDSAPAADELQEMHRMLRQQLAELAYRKSLAGDDEVLVGLDERIRQLTTELEVINTRLVGTTDAGSATSTVADLQGLLGGDAGTVMLNFAITDQHAYGWIISDDAVRGQRIGDRDSVEDTARAVYDTLRKPAYKAAGDEPAVRQLSELLFGALDGLNRSRLVIVPDGALNYIPFGALSLPGKNQALALDTDTEVVVVPSASVLVALRQARAGRPKPSRSVAAIADPVFSLDDARFGGRSVSGAATTSGRPLPRLPYSAIEADLFEQYLDHDDDFLQMRGFAATREGVLDGGLGDYRIVHIASHGLIDARQPALSGIALTAYDQYGTALPNMLLLGDIRQLNLNAELVTLSACETGLGKDIRGEGLVGTVDAFMQAGATGVLASLWPVDDRATAELMKHFYGHLLGSGASPPSALAHAQRAIAATRGWAAPFYWAGFVYQGDWTARPGGTNVTAMTDSR